jgi:hypothetical protein
MIGHGYYKFGDPTQSGAFQSTLELQRQFELTRRNKKVMGNALYSARFVLFNKIGITDMLGTIYSRPALIPFLGREVAEMPAKPSGIRIENNRLIWEKAEGNRSVVYYFTDKKKEGVILSITDDSSIIVSKKGFYCVTSLNSDNKESDPSNVIELN